MTLLQDTLGGDEKPPPDAGRTKLAENQPGLKPGRRIRLGNDTPGRAPCLTGWNLDGLHGWSPGPLGAERTEYPERPMSERRLETDTDDGMVLIISGPSGVGKTTITRGVERSIADSVFSVSCTTRPRTPADVDGVDYHFVSDEAFEEMRSRDDFLETAGVYGKKYGTPRSWVQEQLKRGRLVILEIDVQGAIQVKKHLPAAFAIFVKPPNESELFRRLQSRKREDAAAIQRRFEAAKSEMVQAEQSGVYNVFLVNERIEDSIRRAVDLVQGERQRRRHAAKPQSA